MLLMPLSHCDFAFKVVFDSMMPQTLKSTYVLQQWSGVNAVSFFAPQIFAGESHLLTGLPACLAT